MERAKNVRRLGHLDLPGGGQVVVEEGMAYVGHLKPPLGTSIIDVSDPRNPRLLSQLEVPPDIHSHKARVRDGILFVNYERYPPTEEKLHPRVGLRVLDVSQPGRPREIGFHETVGRGVHRFDIDDRYAYLSTELEGFQGNVVQIVDFKEPSHPVEVSRWWIEGQWIAGGEKPGWKGKSCRVHHGLKRGSRLYVGCVAGGLAIVDLEELTRPTTLSRVNWFEAYPCSFHTALPLEPELRGRRWLVLVQEDTTEDLFEEPPACLWVVDITRETCPVPVSTFQVPMQDIPRRRRFGSHQPCEQSQGPIIPVTWFSGGLRFVDLSDPYFPSERGFFIPEPCLGEPVCQSNDVAADERGIFYLVDRYVGFDILEFEGWP